MTKQLIPRVISTLDEFDSSSGSLLERILFNNRMIILLLCFAATIFFGIEATKVRLSANFTQMIPTHQTYIVNFLNHYDNLRTLSDAVEIAVVPNDGVILDAH